MLRAARLTGASEASPACVEVYGDALYGTPELVANMEAAGTKANGKVQAPSAPVECFSKDVSARGLVAVVVVRAIGTGGRNAGSHGCGRSWCGQSSVRAAVVRAATPLAVSARCSTRAEGQGLC
jgi:hypothetical protein